MSETSSQPQDVTTEQPEATPEPTTVKAPGWKNRRPRTTPPSSPESPAADGPDAGADSLGMSDELPGQPQTKSGSSRTSSRVEKKALTEAVKVGFGTVTSTLHGMFARDEYEQAVELYLADEQDLEAVSEPGGKLLSRRLGDAPMTQDTADGIALLVALAGYLFKQLGKWRLSRQLRSEGAAVQGFQPEYDPRAGSEDQAGPEDPEPAAPAAPFSSPFGPGA